MSLIFQLNAKICIHCITVYFFTTAAISCASESDRANNYDFIVIRFVDKSSFSACTTWCHQIQTDRNIISPHHTVNAEQNTDLNYRQHSLNTCKCLSR